MSLDNELYYLRHQEIDFALWDACINNAANSLIYAQSYYLNALSKNWDAIILGNYKAVMPLPWNRKYGFKYIYPPPFVQQLGIFSEQFVSDNLLWQMLQLAMKQFKFGEYYFNFNTPYPGAVPKNNFILNLNRDYSDIAKSYRKDLIKNLKKVNKLSLKYRSSIDIEKAVRIYQSLYAARTPHVKTEDYNRLISLCKILQRRNEVIVREVKDEQNNILSIALCLQDKGRIYLLLSATTASGRKLEANHFMVDSIIREFSGQRLLLDFEGSDIAGIAHFYKNFGSNNQPYFFYRWNHLPPPVRWLKEKR